MKLRMVTWNVNGIRAWHNRGSSQWFLDAKPDIFCIQETKAHPDQIPEVIRSTKGYESYFNHSKGRKGYSGVAVYSKPHVDHVEYGFEPGSSDEEGRFIACFYPSFVLINCYFPNGGGGPARLAYKLDFYDKFLDFCDSLREQGLSVIFCGDVNTAHMAVDLARPKENEKNTGFLPEERAWIDLVIERGYVDAFRKVKPDVKDAYTYWDTKTRARERNVGWRIDYFFVSDDMADRIKDVVIHSDAFGSDHCPVEMIIDIES
jgi:exodeoxyribonuclease-3